MTAQNVAFWILALAMAGAAVRVVTARNIVHAALYLIVVLVGAAALYIILLAEFVGIVQLFIYIGAIAVLFLFGIMLTRAPMTAHSDLDNDQRWPAAIVSVFLLGVLIALLVDAFGTDKVKLDDRLLHISRTGPVSDSIFRVYVIPFEVVSMLLLAALVGAVVIARRD